MASQSRDEEGSGDLGQGDSDDIGELSGEKSLMFLY
jgi:hypothetical protein